MTFNLDFLIVCTACDGFGYLANRDGEIPFNRECPECHGQGHVRGIFKKACVEIKELPKKDP